MTSMNILLEFSLSLVLLFAPLAGFVWAVHSLRSRVRVFVVALVVTLVYFSVENRLSISSDSVMLMAAARIIHLGMIIEFLALIGYGVIQMMKILSGAK